MFGLPFSIGFPFLGEDGFGIHVPCDMFEGVGDTFNRIGDTAYGAYAHAVLLAIFDQFIFIFSN